jgi:hypothetical protein
LKGVRSAAQEIAELNISASGETEATVSASDEHIEGMVDAVTSLKLYERQVQAAAKVVETADELVGFLLDVHA